ncbi:hypothetical protein [Vallitalea guaymasensis]|uniref:HNH endonuclease n=1 Tax=Vallitalea guaymasensis TaxID=1185412 RepID=A0A8J8M989_9FIRM|nr:hypothetical protein [Vallitalea guaymasensis]QUH28711.1 hypothetical protein HYG85_07210 [Vallitalea guaymasensis]
MNLKKCAKCGQYKHISDFHKNKRNKDGLHSYCKQCNAQKAKSYNKTEKGLQNVKKAQMKQYESGYFKFGKGAISNMSNSAQKRGITFNLDEKTLANWWKNNGDTCYYCGINKITYNKIREYIINYTGNDWEIYRFKKFFSKGNQAQISDFTIDRVDNSVGYQIDNIVKSCWFCNSLKSDFFNEKEMKTIGKLVISNILTKIKEG